MRCESTDTLFDGQCDLDAGHVGKHKIIDDGIEYEYTDFRYQPLIIAGTTAAITPEQQAAVLAAWGVNSMAY